jgi:hypothetical protein
MVGCRNEGIPLLPLKSLGCVQAIDQIGAQVVAREKSQMVSELDAFHAVHGAERVKPWRFTLYLTPLLLTPAVLRAPGDRLFPRGAGVAASVITLGGVVIGFRINTGYAIVSR